ncbi:MAG: hypothetical protein AAFX95_06435 [Cyanobacteria bacterium J06639_16]
MTQLSRQTASTLLKISAILWLIWSVVHALAGILTISGDTATVVFGIADGVDPALLVMDCPDAAGAIIDQHGFNLLWGGVVTIVDGIFVWRKSVGRHICLSSGGWSARYRIFYLHRPRWL